jgi:hypothetical protein
MPEPTPAERFREDDGQGRVLVVYDRDDGKAALRIEGRHHGVRTADASWVADPALAPDLCRAICEASGTLPPVMLGRPGLPADGTSIEVAGFRLWAAGGTVQYEADRTGELAPHAARQLAAVIVALADSVPVSEPAEVEGLAAAIRADFQSDGTPPTEWERKAARAALRWMNGRGKRDA